MPTIIKVQDTSETSAAYINADHMQRVFTSKDSGRHFIQFVDGSVMSVKESPDEIAALIHEAMNTRGSDYKLPVWARERETDLPEGDTLYEQHLKNFQKWYGDPTPGTSTSDGR